MKKALVLLLSLLMVFTMFACGEKVETENKLIFGSSFDYAPFEFMTQDAAGNMQFTGIDYFVAEEIAKDMGKELQVENMGFDFLMTELSNGNYDMVIAAIEATPERLQSADFSDPYYTDYPPMVLIKKENFDLYKDVADFAGKVVGAQTGTTKIDLVNSDFVGATPLGEQLVTDLINELSYDKVDAVVLDGAVALQYAAANEDLVVANVDLGEAYPYCVAVQKGDPKNLLPSINATIKKLVDGGKVNEFVDKAEDLLGVAIEWAPYEEGETYQG